MIVFFCLYIRHMQPLTGLWGAGDALVATDMEALTGFGGMSFGGGSALAEPSHIDIIEHPHPR